MNADPRTARDTAPTAPDLTAAADLLARCKRASLSRQALRAAWDLGALVRRVEREAPEVFRPLHHAVAALQLLSDRLALPPESDRAPRPTGAGATDAAQPAGPSRQGELF